MDGTVGECVGTGRLREVGRLQAAVVCPQTVPKRCTIPDNPGFGAEQTCIRMGMYVSGTQPSDVRQSSNRYLETKTKPSYVVCNELHDQTKWLKKFGKVWRGHNQECSDWVWMVMGQNESDGGWNVIWRLWTSSCPCKIQPQSFYRQSDRLNVEEDEVINTKDAC